MPHFTVQLLLRFSVCKAFLDIEIAIENRTCKRTLQKKKDKQKLFKVSEDVPPFCVADKSSLKYISTLKSTLRRDIE
jgi:hypothetical protein